MVMLKEHQLMDFELLRQGESRDIYPFHMTLYYVLEGSLSVEGTNRKIVLGKRDFLLVNIGHRHSWQMEEHSIVICFSISGEELGRFYDISKSHFFCNSTEGNGEKHDAFRVLLDQCVGSYYGKRSGDGRVLLQLQSVYYQIAEYLVSNYIIFSSEDSLSEDVGLNEESLNEILNFIHTNYQSPITLADMADRLYLSPSYISRYLKKKLGINFGKYLTGVRLDAAVQELMYTDKSMTRIALDNGFPNMAAFNKAFRERYEMTPKQFQEKQAAEDVREPEIADEAMEFRLLDYVGHMDQQSIRAEDQRVTLTVDADSYEYLNKTWSRMINIGHISTLLQSDMQEQVLYLKEGLGFEYVRIWDIYADELRLRVQTGDYNFNVMDKAIDFLISNKMYPWFELGFKPNTLLDSQTNYYLYEERPILFADAAAYADFLKNMMTHMLNRYGHREVSKWYFEQWLDPRLCAGGHYEEYFEFFETAYHEIKSVSPGTVVCGSFDRTYDIIDFEELIAAWSRRTVKPDSMAIYCYRDAMRDLGYENQIHLLTQERVPFIETYIREKKEVMMRYGFDVPVNISEWNLTVSNCNALNDSCFKGAFIMKTLMQIYSQADVIGYWLGSDLFVAEEESLKLLDGCCGLISHQGLRKPAYWAMDFMNHLGNYLLGKTENVMVTKDNYGNYMIACHNCNELDVQYYMMQDMTVEIEQLPRFFEDKVQLYLHIEIDNVENGTYHIKVYNVKTGVGSVQDEWIRMGRIPTLNNQDVEYLRAVSRPRITISETRVENHKLEVDLSLDPQEIQGITIFQQFT
ncbi:MAG: helix-turn-helix domain-containing protein [Clostridiales bacterium]|nr:helix-turn-helix domain-containing protein [Clostridiales bacterium]